MAAEELRSRPRKDKGQPTLGPDAAADDRDNQKRESLKDLVRAQVLGALGAPADLLRVQVRPLWDHCYRVNVIVGADVTCARIPHSYFVMADGDGKVIDSTPKVRKLY